jgi:hypothetical protein
MASAIYGSSSTISTRILSTLSAGAYRRHIETTYLLGDTTLP